LPGEVCLCFSAATGSENAALIAESLIKKGVVPTLIPLPEGSKYVVNEEFLDLVNKAFQVYEHDKKFLTFLEKFELL
jgi:uncharacterized protein YlzI (FlbEa/FlbD family)